MQLKFTVLTGNGIHSHLGGAKEVLDNRAAKRVQEAVGKLYIRFTCQKL